MLDIIKRTPEFSHAFPADNIHLTSPSDIPVERDAVGPLMDYINEYNLPSPVFQNVREEGPAHDRRFVATLYFFFLCCGVIDHLFLKNVLRPC